MKNGTEINGSPPGGSALPGRAGGGLSARRLGGIWLGKLLMGLTRISGRGGTTLPGRAALRFAPDLLSHLAGRLARGSLIVTGTNGKTTTSSLLSGMLKQSGLHCVHNRSGSNMSWGVVSSLIDSCTWTAKLPGDFGVMEADEGAFPEVVRQMRPRGAVVTNIFRDQLDRFGEVDHIQQTIRRGLEALPPEGFQVLNADDPSLTGIESDWPGKKWFYGLELSLPGDRFQNTARDIKSCPRCRRKLHYDRIYFAHLGHYRCPSCDFARPEPEVKLVGRRLNPGGGSILDLRLRGEPLQAAYPLMGTYNLYNALAAITGALAMGTTPEVIAEALKQATPSFGRMERFAMEGRTLLMALIKNPVGANEVMRTLIEREEEIHMFIAINDRVADGTDVSWLWDADFEQLAAISARLAATVVSGLRAWDMAVRLKYAGLDPSGIVVEENMKEALRRAVELTPPGKILFILPTYTAMLELRGILNAMGVGKPYWETGRSH